MNSFFRELKQRKVYLVALGYAVVAWLVIQLSGTVMPAYHAPKWILPIFITAIALGFPVALILAWAFELTPEGLKRTEDLAERPTEPENRAWLRAMKLRVAQGNEVSGVLARSWLDRVLSANGRG